MLLDARRAGLAPWANPYAGARVYKASEFPFATAGWPSLADVLNFVDLKSRRRAKQARVVSLPAWGRPPTAAKCIAYRCKACVVGTVCRECDNAGWFFVVFTRATRTSVPPTATASTPRPAMHQETATP